MGYFFQEKIFKQQNSQFSKKMLQFRAKNVVKNIAIWSQTCENNGSLGQKSS